MGKQLYGEDYALQTALIIAENAAKIKKYKQDSESALSQGNTLEAFRVSFIFTFKVFSI